MNLELFKYDDVDTISDAIICFYNSLSDFERENLKKVIDLYINNKDFYMFLQKNVLIKKINVDYLIRLYNDFDSDNLVDSYDTIVVNTTRWI